MGEGRGGFVLWENSVASWGEVAGRALVCPGITCNTTRTSGAHALEDSKVKGERCTLRDRRHSAAAK